MFDSIVKEYSKHPGSLWASRAIKRNLNSSSVNQVVFLVDGLGFFTVKNIKEDLTECLNVVDESSGGLSPDERNEMQMYMEQFLYDYGYKNEVNVA